MQRKTPVWCLCLKKSHKGHLETTGTASETVFLEQCTMPGLYQQDVVMQEEVPVLKMHVLRAPRGQCHEVYTRVKWLVKQRLHNDGVKAQGTYTSLPAFLLALNLSK